MNEELAAAPGDEINSSSPAPEPVKPAKRVTRRKKVGDTSTENGAPPADVQVEETAPPPKKTARRRKAAEEDSAPAGDSHGHEPTTSASDPETASEAPPKRRVSRRRKVTEADLPEPPALEGQTASESSTAPPAAFSEQTADREVRETADPSAAQPVAQWSEDSPTPQKSETAGLSREERRQRRRFRNRRRGRFSTNGDFRNDREAEAEEYSSSEEEAPLPENYVPTYEEGIVEISGKGFGFLRDAGRNFVQSNTDTFVTPEVVRRHGLRDGMWIKGEIRQGHRGPQLFKLTELEGEDPENYKNLPVFEELTTINPIEWIKLETTPDRYTTRVIDLMAPIGKGQRGLLVAPPRTGKTTILQHIAEALAENHPEIKLLVLLVDERPEEVTELRRCLPTAEVLASSNDSDLKSHTRIAQLAIDRARRLVEMGKDVFVLMDSLTRIGRAFNNAQTGKGRTMSGGVDSRALEIPRKLFAAARNTEEAGSLTIVATALIETGSRMDELIFLEFKGTGNMELVLDRKISDQRVYPAADIFQSGTRREELLLPADTLHKINVIRRGLAGHKPIEAIERLLFFLKKYPSNQEMLANIPG